jgi:acetylornithine deacetylase/succinyl-diaminopimelate desuccinylase-like protein
VETSACVRQLVAREEASLLRELCAYVDCGGVSSTGSGVTRTHTFLRRLLADLGAEVRLHPGARHPYVLARLQCADPDRKPTVLIYGHYDVQPPGPPDAWVTPPFESEIRGGRIFGRGVADNKGQHFAFIHAVRLLCRQGALPCNVILLIEGEEEIGSPGIRTFVERHRLELNADLVIWSDGPVHDSARPTVSLGVRGCIQFELSATGVNGHLHSGNWGGVASNPVWRLVWVLAALHGPGGTILLPGFEEEAFAPLSSTLQPALERGVADAAVVLDGSDLAPPRERSFGDRVARYPSFTVSGILPTGDLDPRIPSIPGSATAFCDLRLVPGQQCDPVVFVLRERLAELDPGVRVIVRAQMEPSGTAPDSPYVSVISEALTHVHGSAAEVVPPLGGALPLYAFTEILDIPCVGVPIANIDSANHAVNENLEVRRFLDGVVAATEILCRVGESASDLPTFSRTALD